MPIPKIFYGGGGLGEKGVRMKHTFFEKMSVPKIPPASQQPFINLVDTILTKKQNNEDTTGEEQQIDVLVYKLYELSYEEVLVVDQEFPLSQEAYDNYQIV